MEAGRSWEGGMAQWAACRAASRRRRAPPGAAGAARPLHGPGARRALARCGRAAPTAARRGAARPGAHGCVSKPRGGRRRMVTSPACVGRLWEWDRLSASLARRGSAGKQLPRTCQALAAPLARRTGGRRARARRFDARERMGLRRPASRVLTSGAASTAQLTRMPLRRGTPAGLPIAARRWTRCPQPLDAVNCIL